MERNISINWRKLLLSYNETYEIFYNNTEYYTEYNMQIQQICWYCKEFYPYNNTYSFLLKINIIPNNSDAITLRGLIKFFLYFLSLYPKDKRIKKIVNRLTNMLKCSEENILVKYKYESIVEDRFQKGIISYCLNNNKIKIDALKDKERGELY